MWMHGQDGCESLNLLFLVLSQDAWVVQVKVCVCVCVCILCTFEIPDMIGEVLQKPNRLALRPIVTNDREVEITKIYCIQHSVSH